MVLVRRAADERAATLDSGNLQPAAGVDKCEVLEMGYSIPELSSDVSFRCSASTYRVARKYMRALASAGSFACYELHRVPWPLVSVCLGTGLDAQFTANDVGALTLSSVTPKYALGPMMR